MKNILISSVAAILILFGITSISAEPSSYKYKELMHHVLESYTHTRISYTMKKYDVADIFLKHIQDYLKEAIDVIPEHNTEGVKLDRSLITKKLNDLKQKMAGLRIVVQKRELKEINQFSQEIFNMCVTCHKSHRVKHLFKYPLGDRETLFQEYMHEVSEYFKTTRTYAENGEFKEAEDYLKLINFYLSLLEGIFPDKGPSGIILDRDGFVRRIKDFEKLNEDAQKNIKEKKMFDSDSFKKSLNELCVACHEPERVK